jgi:hypothetical protein
MLRQIYSIESFLHTRKFGICSPQSAVHSSEGIEEEKLTVFNLQDADVVKSQKPVARSKQRFTFAACPI